MSEHSTDDPARTLRERGARYVVDTRGQTLAVLLTMEEYEHYLDLLDNADGYIREADSQDAELATRVAEAAARPRSDGGRVHPERQSFRDYLRQREASRGDEIQG